MRKLIACGLIAFGALLLERRIWRASHANHRGDNGDNLDQWRWRHSCWAIWGLAEERRAV